MPSQANSGGTKPGQDKAARGSGISGLPEQQRKHGPRAGAVKHRRRPTDAVGGPGGLGYVLGLDEEEQAEIDWHPEETDAKAPPRSG